MTPPIGLAASAGRIAHPGEPDPVAQSRFFLSKNSANDTRQEWTVPVCLKTSGKPVCRLLSPGEATLPIPAAPFFYANAAAIGYYRTAYTPKQNKAIEAAVETALTPAERINFIGDRWALVFPGRSTVADQVQINALEARDAARERAKETKAAAEQPA
ncbi:MAG: hypothetical protein J0H08_14665, partial [Rhizobiales bacterium]|nr:hypothetical protein [Hyphomicrobiales bacterium]